MTILPIHIIAGIIALVSGAIALYAAKGAKVHRKSGMIFVYAMLVMAGSGALMAIIVEFNRVNVIAGALTFYLVCTALFTVRRDVARIRWIDVGFMLVGLAVGIIAVSLSVAASQSTNGRLDGMPAAGYFIFGTVALLAALGDIRMLARGIPGAKRIARHLWRMGLALFIATASFFLGQADEFPQAIRESRLLAVPVLSVVLTTIYWWVRVSFTQWYKPDYLKIPANFPAARLAVEPARSRSTTTK